MTGRCQIILQCWGGNKIDRGMLANRSILTFLIPVQPCSTADVWRICLSGMRPCLMRSSGSVQQSDGMKAEKTAGDLYGVAAMVETISLLIADAPFCIFSSFSFWQCMNTLHSNIVCHHCLLYQNIQTLLWQQEDGGSIIKMVYSLCAQHQASNRKSCSEDVMMLLHKPAVGEFGCNKHHFWNICWSTDGLPASK